MMPCGLSPGKINSQDTQNLLLKNLHTKSVFMYCLHLRKHLKLVEKHF